MNSNYGKTPYELWFGYKPTTKYFKIFGRKFYIKRDDDIGNFDARSNEGIFLGYSTKSKTYWCYNKRLRNIVESASVKVDEDSVKSSRWYNYNSDEDNTNQGKNTQTPNLLQIIPYVLVKQPQVVSKNQVSQEAQTSASVEENLEDTEVLESPKTPRYVKLNHSESQIIGNKSEGVQTRRNNAEEYCLISKIEPKSVIEAYQDEHWLEAMK